MLCECFARVGTRCLLIQEGTDMALDLWFYLIYALAALGAVFLAAILLLGLAEAGDNSRKEDFNAWRRG